MLGTALKDSVFVPSHAPFLLPPPPTIAPLASPTPSIFLKIRKQTAIENRYGGGGGGVYVCVCGVVCMCVCVCSCVCVCVYVCVVKYT